METLVKVIDEKMLLIDQLQNQLENAKKEIETANEFKFYWFKKFTELEKTLTPQEND